MRVGMVSATHRYSDESGFGGDGRLWHVPGIRTTPLRVCSDIHDEPVAPWTFSQEANAVNSVCLGIHNASNPIGHHSQRQGSIKSCMHWHT